MSSPTSCFSIKEWFKSFFTNKDLDTDLNFSIPSVPDTGCKNLLVSDEDLFNFNSHSDSSANKELHCRRSIDEFDPDMNIDLNNMFGPKDRYDIHEDQFDIHDSIRKYDAFLSFRGENTRASFTSHLFASLQSSGLTSFKDDHSLQRGHRISELLLQAIQESRISVVVFSKNYADSQWCLQELMQIMECHRTIGQVVLPVFYDVHPSEVRHQTGDFGKAFQDVINRILKVDEFMVPKWRNALRDAAGLAGFVVLNSRLLLSLHFPVSNLFGVNCKPPKWLVFFL